MYDVIIVGAGPAGLNAALVLGRARRRVLICDSGKPRNAASPALHGFLSRDGTPPLELLRIGRDELASYPSVEFAADEAVEVQRRRDRFSVHLSSGRDVTCRMLLLATGVLDRLPDVESVEDFYAKSVFHCPYCDGWEVRHRKLAAYGKRSLGVNLALELTCWSDDIILFTDGNAELSNHNMRRLHRSGIDVRQEPVRTIEGEDGRMSALVLEDGTRVERDAMFFKTAFRQHSSLCHELGCEFTAEGAVDTGKYESTNVPGLYVAGDASKKVQLAIVAAAEGAQAAFAINTALVAADLE